MSDKTDIFLPDLGDFEQVEVVEVLVKPGDSIAIETPLLVLESDKASLEVPSPYAGTVDQLHVVIGDQIAKGALLLTLTQQAADTVSAEPAAEAQPEPDKLEHKHRSADSQEHADVVVLGGGPGGYTAAFRAADLGKRVILIEKGPTLGGVCLNVGCIPSKALLHVAENIESAKEGSAFGVTFAPPEIDLNGVRDYKNRVVKQLTTGLSGLAKQRHVQVIQGEGVFKSEREISVTGDEGEVIVSFSHCIIAVGSRSIQIPSFPHDHPRVMDSTDALELESVPQHLLVLGGGIIGLEMATVYHALGSKITIVELTDQLIPGCDPELVKPLEKKLKGQCERILLSTRVTEIKASDDGVTVYFSGKEADYSERFDKVLVSVGRRPNGDLTQAQAAGVEVTDNGFIPVGHYQRTSVQHIYAIGDVTGQPMLAHKAVHEGKVAAEVICGLPSAFDVVAIPSVAYTHPEVAWVGLSEAQAKEQGLEVEVGKFPWAASGRALSSGNSNGLTKLIFDATSKRLLGAGIVGAGAGELISELTLALEMGTDMEDIALTIHPHPTLAETVALSAEMAHGSITDLFVPKKT